ncbi:MAG: carbohydrate ABC transporter permease, partial [Gemmobacter sp.]
MTDLSAPARPRAPLSRLALRWGLYAMLALFAAWYLMPLFVMLTTSLKSLE